VSPIGKQNFYPYSTFVFQTPRRYPSLLQTAVACLLRILNNDEEQVKNSYCQV